MAFPSTSSLAVAIVLAGIAVDAFTLNAPRTTRLGSRKSVGPSAFHPHSSSLLLAIHSVRRVGRPTHHCASPQQDDQENFVAIKIDEQDEEELPSASLLLDQLFSVWIFAVVPLVSLGLPLLLQANMIGALVIAKRIYIYALAASVVLIASHRGSSDDPALGSRLIALTKEILPRWETLTSMDLTSSNLDENNNKSQQQDDRFDTLGVLDNVETSAQAISLPILVGSSLAVSLLILLLLQTDVSSSSSSSGEEDLVRVILQSFQSLLPSLTTWSNGLVLALFARAELVRLPLPLPQAGATLAAVTLSFIAFVGPSDYVWPVHNMICICLAVAVARVIQLPRLGPILLALGLLVVYDVVSVGLQLIDLGSQTVAASSGTAGAITTTTTTTTAAAGASAMGAVAMSKAGAAWQPGLLEVRLRGMVTDLLGLGDAVFPSLLATYCLRYDKEEQNTNYFAWSIVGFAAGCLLCEGIPGISNAGLPALLFLVPSMMTFVAVPVVLQGNLPSFWAFDPANKRTTDERGGGVGDAGQ